MAHPSSNSSGTDRSVGKSFTEAPSKRELKVHIYINNVLLRKEVVYDIRGGWALNQFTNAIQEEAERGYNMSDEDLETIKSLNAGTNATLSNLEGRNGG